MKILSVSIMLLFALVSHSQADIDVLHYQYEFTLSDDHDTISGRATIEVKFLQHVDQLQFDLTTQAKGKGMMVTDVTENNKTVEHYHTNNKVIIKLDRGTKNGETSRFTIFYKGIPADGLIISKNKYGHRTFFADNWPDRGHNWIPCVDQPGDKASVEFIVTAPQHYQVVANGVQVEETNITATAKRTHWKEDVPVSTKVMVIGVADFAVNLAGTVDGCTPVYSWVYPEDRTNGFYDYAQATEILPFYIKNVGPYGYKKLANVESKTRFGGLENASTIFYSESSITGKRRSESLLAHEIAHQWFGNMATEKTFAHLWLSEGFATYMTILYMENKYGADTAIAMLKEDRDQVIAFAKTSARTVVDTTSDYMKLLNANSYQKGGWVLHMLRKQLGDALFWQCIRKYYALYAGKTADTDDLRKVFENESGQSLEKFFRQWLFTPGIPEIAIGWKYVAATKKIEVTVEQRQKSGAFSFPLQLGLVDSDGKMVVEKIQVNATSGVFQFTTKTKPVRMVADPGLAVLMQASVSEVR